MLVQVKLTEGQIQMISQLNAIFEQAKSKMDIAIGSIVMGKVKKGEMKEIKDGVIVIECDESDLIVDTPEVLPPETPKLEVTK